MEQFETIQTDESEVHSHGCCPSSSHFLLKPTKNCLPTPLFWGQGDNTLSMDFCDFDTNAKFPDCPMQTPQAPPYPPPHLGRLSLLQLPLNDVVSFSRYFGVSIILPFLKMPLNFPSSADKPTLIFGDFHWPSALFEIPHLSLGTH